MQVRRPIQDIIKHVSRRGGFSLVEVLNVAFISSFVIAVLLYALNSGQWSWAVNSARAQAQSEARRTIDWITKDARQTVSWELADAGNAPSGTHIKFRQVQGYDTGTGTLQLASDYVEYTYDAVSQAITRRLSDASDTTLQTWTFNNIMEDPFYTKDNSENTVVLNSGDLLTSRTLIVTIRVQEQTRGSSTVETTLTDEVKIRNE